MEPRQDLSVRDEFTVVRIQQTRGALEYLRQKIAQAGHPGIFKGDRPEGFPDRQADFFPFAFLEFFENVL